MAYKIKGSKSVMSLNKLIDDIHEVHPIKIHKHPHWVWLQAMYLGYQYSYQDWENDTLKEMIIDSETRSDYNLLGGFVDVFIAKMLARDPIPQVRPLTAHEDDIKAAEKSSLALEYWWYKENLRAVWHDVVRWATILGNGFIKCYWNKDDGVPISIGQTTFKEGEANVEAFPPYNAFPDPAAKDMETCRWFIHSYVKPLETIQREFPKKAKKLTGETKLEEYKSQLASYTQDSTDTKNASSLTLGEENVLVKEYWERAIPGHDAGAGEGKGLFKIRASGETLYKGPNPYEDRLPFFSYVVKRKPDSFWGEGLADRLTTPQIDLNRLHSQTMNNIDWTANTKILLPDTAQVDEEQFNKEEGGFVRYEATGAKPEQLQITPFSSSVLTFIDVIVQRMMHISGLHELSFAQLPERSSQTSGRVTDTLMEAEETRFAPEVNALKETMEDLAEHYLFLASENYVSTYAAATASRYTGEVESAKFTKEELKGNVDVFIEVGGGFGLSPSAKTERLLGLWDRGLIQDPTVILENLQYGTISRVFSDVVADNSKAERHLQKIVEFGRAPEVSKYDNHEKIMTYFVKFIKTSEYDTLHPDQKHVIDQYLESHERYLMERAAMQQQQQQPQAPGGQPPATQGQMDASMGQATGPPQANIQDQPALAGV